MDRMKSATNQQASILQHLQVLVACDSQNPPRSISKDSEIFNYLQQNLGGFEFEFIDAGDGCLCLLATRGSPSLLFNFHIDTVPIAPGWQNDPFALQVETDKVTGLGACDIKGAAACMLSAASRTSGDVALLFSSDEEFGSSAAVRAFLATSHGFRKVIVAEPTLVKAVIAHRGIQSATFTIKGVSGHASEARAISDSAIHRAARWSSAALDWVAGLDETFDNLRGMPFNIGKISGGIKANMIAADCELKIGFRPLPGQDPLKILNQLVDVDQQDSHKKNTQIEVQHTFNGPSLPAANQSLDQTLAHAKEFARLLKLPLGEAVNFWTEASLFSLAGLTAIVFGPGNIAQAHTANEWVSIDQLLKVEQLYCNILSDSQNF
jgi:acetylornithine deacetylase